MGKPLFSPRPLGLGMGWWRPRRSITAGHGPVTSGWPVCCHGGHANHVAAGWVATCADPVAVCPIRPAGSRALLKLRAESYGSPLPSLRTARSASLTWLVVACLRSAPLAPPLPLRLAPRTIMSHGRRPRCRATGASPATAPGSCPGGSRATVSKLKSPHHVPPAPSPTPNLEANVCNAFYNPARQFPLHDQR
jgi:hypothetical protein